MRVSWGATRSARGAGKWGLIRGFVQTLLQVAGPCWFYVGRFGGGLRVGEVGGSCCDQLCDIGDAEVGVVSGYCGWWQMRNYFGHSEFPQGNGLRFGGCRRRELGLSITV